MFYNRLPDTISNNGETKYVEVLPGIAMDAQHMIDELKADNNGLLDMLYVCVATTHDDDKTWSTWYLVKRTVKAVDYPFTEAAADPVEPYSADWSRHGTNFHYFLMFYYDVRPTQVKI